ncbi:MAG: hypothetical protein AAB425_10630 [Bdellovibrionota bacterium]
MASLSTESHLDRKSLKAPDAFQDSVRSIFDVLAENWRQFLMGLGAVLLTALAVAFFLKTKESNQAAARDGHFLAEQKLDKDLRALAARWAFVPGEVPAVPPLNAESGGALDDEEADSQAGSDKDDAARPDETPAQVAKRKADKLKAREKEREEKIVQSQLAVLAYKPFDVEKELPAGVAALKEVSGKYAGSHAAIEADMTLGQLYYNHGRPEEAARFFKSVADRAQRDIDKAFAWSALGYALEASGKYADAIPAF